VWNGDQLLFIQETISRKSKAIANARSAAGLMLNDIQ
jgi:hypothetical protein